MSVRTGKEVLALPLSPGLCRHDGYTHHPCDPAQRLTLLRGKVRDAAEGHGRQTFLAGWLNGSDELVGVLIAGRFSLGEECFSLGMAHVHCFLVDPGFRAASKAAKELYLAFTDWAVQLGIVHVACRTGSDNRPVIDLFASFGLQPVDHVVLHLVRPGHPPRFPRLKAFHEIRAYRSEDREQIIGHCTGGFTTSRFVTDPDLPEEGKKQFFRSWAERICDGVMSDRIWVAVDRQGSVVGFMGWKTQSNWLLHLDIKVAGEGLGAVLPSGTGAYVPMLRHCILDAFADRDENGPKRPIDVAELETQALRTEVIKVWNRLGIEQVGSRRTYHHWLTR